MFELRAAFTEENRIEMLFQEEVSRYLVGILQKTEFLNEFKESVKDTFAVKDKQINNKAKSTVDNPLG
ncbi:hypothetical protein [Bacillus cereus]|uniref:hypothetical protein n=1 Tax=Bacillus cereus TaxID=1396 RepID=UPI001124EE52|nr:hypothetical protein [Bacillus cereus]